MPVSATGSFSLLVTMSFTSSVRIAPSDDARQHPSCDLHVNSIFVAKMTQQHRFLDPDPPEHIQCCHSEPHHSEEPVGRYQKRAAGDEEER